MSRSDPPKKDQAGTIIDLKILHEAPGQKLSLFFEEKRKGEEGPLQSYINTNVSPCGLKSISDEIYSLLYASTYSSEHGAGNITKKLQQAGLDLYNSIFPLPIKKRLAAAGSTNLYLTISESLLHIPWELAYDGEAFLCLRFNMGRKVYTSHQVVGYKAPECQRIRMLILADPKNDLPKSYQEGILLHKKLENWGDLLDVNIVTTSIDSKMVSRQIFEYDILHYAGHAVYNQDNPDMSGWVLEDGTLSAQRIMQLAGCKKPLPGLIFSNACQSGQTSEWSKTDQKNWSHYYAYDLVNAFLRSGVQHYIGTFQEVRDLSSLSLGLHFYESMAQSCSIGEALRKARMRFIRGCEEHGKDNLIWAHYMLYGDPTIHYFNNIQAHRETGKGEYIREIREQNRADELLVGSPGLAGDDTRAKGSSGATSARTGDEAFESADHRGTRAAKGIHMSKKWGKWVALGIIAGMVLSLFFMKFRERPAMEHAGGVHRYTDLEWEEKKWEIVERIMEGMRQGYRPGDSDTARNAPLSGSSSIAPAHYTLCIIPSDPVIKDTDTELLVEELLTFFEQQPDYIVVERERLDFVIRELALKTLNLTEDKLRFSLGAIFDARGILFVKVFELPHRLPRLTHRKEAFLRLVDTKTTAITARAADYLDPYDIKGAAGHLGEQLIASLEKRMKDGTGNDGQAK
ncbi:MAG: CHAT domain-containing protein [bacterium]